MEDREQEVCELWEDNWVPNSVGFRILGHARGLDKKATVDIDSDLCRWNRELVMQCFNLSEAN